MHFDHDDLRALPLHMQEQVGVAVLAQIEKNQPVAGREMKPPLRVPVKRLCFSGARAAARYEILRDAARQGVISELDAVTYDGYVVSLTYRITWAGEFIPTGLPVRDLIAWRNAGKGTAVTEPIKKRRYRDEEKETLSEPKAGAVSQQ